MSTTVEREIRTHLHANDAVQETIDWAEIVSRYDTDVPVVPAPERSRGFGIWVAVAAAVATLLLIGGVAWLTSFDGAVPPADQPTVTTVPADEPTVTTAPADEPTVTTVPADEPTVTTAPAETSEGPIVLLAEAGPAPRFDTSPLGLEVVFEPWQPGDDIWGHLSELVANSELSGYVYPFIVGDRLEDRLMAPISDDELLVLTEILYVGRATENGWELLLVTTGETVCSMLLPGGGSACGIGDSESYGLISAAGGNTAAITVRVPLETSVVGIITHDGQRFWQRPIGGWGLFDVPWWPEGTPGPTVIAFDADGIQIGQWCSGTPDPSNPDCTS